MYRPVIFLKIDTKPNDTEKVKQKQKVKEMSIKSYIVYKDNIK